MGIFDFFRKAKKPAATANGFTVSFDQESVICRRPDGKEESVSWADLRAVLLRTTSDGPFVDDVFWILVGQNGGCVVPSESTGVTQLLERLQELPGFNNEVVIKAMQLTNDHEFLCWISDEGKKILERNDLEGQS